MRVLKRRMAARKIARVGWAEVRTKPNIHGLMMPPNKCWASLRQPNLLARISSFSGKTDLPGFSPKIDPNNAFFEPQIVGWNRLDDAEAKLYQQIVDATIHDSNISGTLRVVIDRPSCGSCVGAAEKLLKVRPNLNIEVIQGPIPLPPIKR